MKAKIVQIKKKVVIAQKQRGNRMHNVSDIRIFFENVEKDNMTKIINKDIIKSCNTHVLSDNETDFNLIIMLVPLEALSNFHFFIDLADSDFRKFNANNKYKPVPIIFITALSILPNCTNDVTEDERKEFRSRIDCFNFDKRIEFLDSSIWHYYLSIEDWNGRSFSENLKEVLTTICKNYDLKLYKTNVAKEFLEFQVRTMKQSYIANLSSKHSNYIIPFVYHLETRMRYAAKEIIKNLVRTYSSEIKEIRWNVLLIDDYAKEKLSIGSQDHKNEVGETKEYILKKLICKTFSKNINIISTGKEEILEEAFSLIRPTRNTLYNEVMNKLKLLMDENNPDINKELKESIIEYAYKINGNTKINKSKEVEIINLWKNFLKEIDEICNSKLALNICKKAPEDYLKVKVNNFISKIEKLVQKQYDIILLDYLLGKKHPDSYKREFGEDFLRKIETNEHLKKQKGPLGKFWIFPISSFNTAMLSKLRESGIGRISDNWYIMNGADMINTPNLFVYNFLKLIELQLTTAIVTKEDVAKFIIDNTDDILIEENYSIRKYVRRLYGIFMHKFGLREALKSDQAHGSAFAKSVLAYMSKEKSEDLQFYESVRKLLYLVGYSTHADAALMWDLLTYIDSVVESIESDVIKINTNEVKDFLKYIRRYISELKQ